MLLLALASRSVAHGADRCKVLGGVDVEILGQPVLVLEFFQAFRTEVLRDDVVDLDVATVSHQHVLLQPAGCPMKP